MSGVCERFGLDEDEVVAAIEEQEPYVRSWLLARGLGDGADDVMGQVAEELLGSLERWERAGRPVLGAWARGVATNALRVYVRTGLVGAERAVSLDGLVEAGFDVAVPTEESGSRSAAAVLVSMLEAHVLAGPRGAVRWAQMVGPGGRVRGKSAAAALRREVAAVDPTGLWTNISAGNVDAEPAWCGYEDLYAA